MTTIIRFAWFYFASLIGGVFADETDQYQDDVL